MSKKVKNLIQRDLADRLKDIDGVAVINPRGINATKNNAIRRKLREKGVRMTVVKNTLARRAATKTKLEGFDKLLEGPSAVIYGKVSIAQIARLLLEEKKNDETLELRGAFFDGEVYVGDKGMEQVSKLPTREEGHRSGDRRHPLARQEARRRDQGPQQHAGIDPQDDRRQSQGKRRRRPAPAAA